MQTIKEQFHALTAEFRATTSKERKDEITKELQNLMATGGVEASEALEESFEALEQQVNEVWTKQSFGFVFDALSVTYIARTYFGKTRPWLSQKLNGNLVNGKPAQFTDSERKQLKNALADIGKRIIKISERL